MQPPGRIAGAEGWINSRRAGGGVSVNSTTRCNTAGPPPPARSPPPRTHSLLAPALPTDPTAQRTAAIEG